MGVPSRPRPISVDGQLPVPLGVIGCGVSVGESCRHVFRKACPLCGCHSPSATAVCNRVFRLGFSGAPRSWDVSHAHWAGVGGGGRKTKNAKPRLQVAVRAKSRKHQLRVQGACRPWSALLKANGFPGAHDVDAACGGRRAHISARQWRTGGPYDWGRMGSDTGLTLGPAGQYLPNQILVQLPLHCRRRRCNGIWCLAMANVNIEPLGSHKGEHWGWVHAQGAVLSLYHRGHPSGVSPSRLSPI